MLSKRITPLGDLRDRITLELITEIARPHNGLLAAKKSRPSLLEARLVWCARYSVSCSLRQCSQRMSGHPMSARWGIEDPSNVEETDNEKEREEKRDRQHRRSGAGIGLSALSERTWRAAVRL
ncbi:hypothetical protein [Arvimicrobium flavum]|uniref:hypothetical protein n=1 Tax=Arvimicrobium flavum TaxID=3393320 RepID=UPI00237B129D|nr:hypothetical protein [Mesorhizobium shangrilense]